jgi:hypothetical protein
MALFRLILSRMVRQQAQVIVDAHDRRAIDDLVRCKIYADLIEDVNWELDDGYTPEEGTHVLADRVYTDETADYEVSGFGNVRRVDTKAQQAARDARLSSIVRDSLKDIDQTEKVTGLTVEDLQAFLTRIRQAVEKPT